MVYRDTSSLIKLALLGIVLAIVIIGAVIYKPTFLSRLKGSTLDALNQNPDLIAYFPFDDPSNPPGKYGQAKRMSSNGFFPVPANPPIISYYTVSMWIKTSAQNVNIGSIMVYAGMPNISNIASTISVSDGQWHFMAYAYGKNPDDTWFLNLFIDDQKFAKTWGPGPSPFGDLRSSIDITTPSDVDLDDIRVYKRAFQDTEIDEIYRATLPQCSDGIDNDGDTFIDFSAADPGCTDANDNDETDPAASPPGPTCGNNTTESDSRCVFGTPSDIPSLTLEGPTKIRKANKEGTYRFRLLLPYAIDDALRTYAGGEKIRLQLTSDQPADVTSSIEIGFCEAEFLPQPQQAPVGATEPMVISQLVLKKRKICQGEFNITFLNEGTVTLELKMITPSVDIPGLLTWLPRKIAPAEFPSQQLVVEVLEETALPAEPIGCGNGMLEDTEQCDLPTLAPQTLLSNCVTCQLQIPIISCTNDLLKTEEKCDDNNTVNNDGCSSECQIESVAFFVTSETFVSDLREGALSGIQGADAKCQRAADNASLPDQTGLTTWKAFISDDTQQVKDLDLPPYSLYYTLDGRIMARGKTQLFSGNIENPVFVNEFGQPYTNSHDDSVWTGSMFDGSTANDYCKDPGGLTPPGFQPLGQVGFADATDASWLDYAPKNCSINGGPPLNALYCYSTGDFSPLPRLSASTLPPPLRCVIETKPCDFGEVPELTHSPDCGDYYSCTAFPELPMKGMANVSINQLVDLTSAIDFEKIGYPKEKPVLNLYFVSLDYPQVIIEDNGNEAFIAPSLVFDLLTPFFSTYIGPGSNASFVPKKSGIYKFGVIADMKDDIDEGKFQEKRSGFKVMVSELVEVKVQCNPETSASKQSKCSFMLPSDVVKGAFKIEIPKKGKLVKIQDVQKVEPDAKYKTDRTVTISSGDDFIKADFIDANPKNLITEPYPLLQFTLQFDTTVKLDDFIPFLAIQDTKLLQGSEFYTKTSLTQGIPALTLTEDRPLDIKVIGTDEKPPEVSFQFSTSSGSESVTPAQISVMLSFASSQPVTVKISTKSGTAVTPDDFMEMVDQELRFNPGETQKNIPVIIIDDTAKETNELFQLMLKNPANAVLGATSIHAYTIVDNDSLQITSTFTYQPAGTTPPSGTPPAGTPPSGQPPPGHSAAKVKYCFDDPISQISDTYWNFICLAKERGFISGTVKEEKTYFNPLQPINRVEAAKILTLGVLKSLGKMSDQQLKSMEDELKTSSFKKLLPYRDMKKNEDAWFFPYVALATRENIMSGYPDDTFQPEKKINNVEAYKAIVETFRIASADGEALLEEAEKKTARSKNWFMKYIKVFELSKIDYSSDYGELIDRKDFIRLVMELLAVVGG